MPTGFATARIDPEAPKALPPRTGSAAVPEGEPWRALTRPQAPRGGVLLHHGRRHAAPQMLWHVCCSQRPRQYASASYERGTHGKTPVFLVLTPAYWITSSARRRREGGIVIPSALAVLRLITSSNLVGCSTGSSAGLAPLRRRST
jgi:hypothetical protein